MAKTLVDVDSDKLAAVQRILGTATKKDTINQALGEVIALAARRRELARLSAGEYADLGDANVMGAAWQ